MGATDPIDFASGATTVAVQRYLDALAQDPSPDPIVRALVTRSVQRLERLCGVLLHRSYPRLTRAPLALEAGDVLGAVVERLLKATREVRPRDARQFFALANRHIRWELNTLARSLDESRSVSATGLEVDHSIPAPAVTDTGLSPALTRLLAAIDELSEEQREAFDLVRVQGLTHPEAASVLGVSTKTVQRRLHDASLFLEERVGALRSDETAPAE